MPRTPEPIRYRVTFIAGRYRNVEHHRTVGDYRLRATALGWHVEHVEGIPPYSLLVDRASMPRGLEGSQ